MRLPEKHGSPEAKFEQAADTALSGAEPWVSVHSCPATTSEPHISESHRFLGRMEKKICGGLYGGPWLFLGKVLVVLVVGPSCFG